MFKSLRVLVAATVVLAALLVSGCDGDSGTSGGAGSVEITEADDGKTVQATVGDEIVLRLESNASTGYSWKVTKEPDPAGLSDAGHEYEQPDGGVVGAAGQELFMFDAEAVGSAEIALDYVGPGTDAEVGGSFSVTVEVGGQE